MKYIEKAAEFAKKYRIQILCIGGGFLLFLVCLIVNPGRAEDIKEIERSGYGSKKTESLYVDGLEEEPVQMEIEVGAREYGPDEIDDAMSQCLTDTTADALGENASLQEVCYDLALPDANQEYGFKFTWDSDDRNLVTSAGTVYNEELKEARDVLLRVTVSNRNYQRDFVVPITVIPRQYSDAEKRQNGLLQLISAADKNSATKPKVELPDEYDGRSIRFRNTEDQSYNIIWILGIVAAILFYLRDKENARTDREKQFKQMQIDYPEIVSKLLVFVGAGLSVRMAWDAVAKDYESYRKNNDKSEIRYAYEELCKANNRLKTGAPEGAVYRAFGRQCHSKQYMKLASLLEQNRKSGVANLKSMLQMEMLEAWEERKNFALRQGEEASTKLLIPLIMLLAIVMVIIMVPALMGFL
ncbi:MAG: hypothetical protein Q4E54_02910 [Lachnospiraceae bacterium]|nr:hypothetical protein [Lachnospiraceae bacterium]